MNNPPINKNNLGSGGYDQEALRAAIAPDARPMMESAPKLAGKTRVLVSLCNVCKSYTSPNGETTEVLKQLNLEIKAGSFTVIRGESGSGKTSLLRILGLLDSNFAGKYL